MRIFDKQEAISFDVFCREFYDDILDPIPELGAKAIMVFPEHFKESISEADERFSNVDIQKLAEQIIAIRLELFSLAWTHQYGERLSIAQSIFTKRYLNDKSILKVWGAMGVYNRYIAGATTSGTSDTQKAQIIRNRADLADNYVKTFELKGIEVDERLGWAINRLYSEKAWENGYIYLMVTLALWDQLGFGPEYIEPNKEASFRLGAYFDGFYKGARHAMKKVKIKN